MRRTRVIPAMLLADRGFYKTRKFKFPKYIGDPINTIRLFNEFEVDEILVTDILATKSGAGPDFEFLKELCSEAFIPFSYGGGINNIKQAENVLRCGVEKIIINNGGLKNPSFISECSREFGASSIVVSVDFTENYFGRRQLYDYLSKKNVKDFSLVEAASRAEELGAGELMINSVNKDGTMAGPDLEGLKQVCSEITIPVIACGGVRNIADIQKLRKNGASAIAAGSFFVFHGTTDGILVSYPSQKTLDKMLD